MPARRPRPAPEPLPVTVRRRPAIDPEPPYDDVLVSGALALADAAPVTLRLPEPTEPAAPRTPPPPLRLLPGGRSRRTARIQPAPDVGGLAPPGPLATLLVRAVLEVLCADRPLRQLARWVTPELYDELEAQVRAGATRPWAASVRRMRVCEPVPGVAEIAAVIDQGRRAVALAMRMEGVDGGWRLTALQLG